MASLVPNAARSLAARARAPAAPASEFNGCPEMKRGFLDKPSPAALEAAKKKAQDEAEGRADILVLMESPDSNVFRLRLSSMKKAPKVPNAARKALGARRGRAQAGAILATFCKQYAKRRPADKGWAAPEACRLFDKAGARRGC